MNPGLKMMLVDRTRKMPEDRPEMRRPRMEYDNMEMRGRSRDRRGRFTGDTKMNLPYDYAPYDDMESRFRDNRRSEHRGNMNIRNDMDNHWTQPYYEETGMEGNGGINGTEMELRNPVGFNARFDPPGKSDASYRRMENEMESRGSPKMEHGGAKSHGGKLKLDENMASEWAMKMQNEDGTRGPHWTKGQVREVMEERGIAGQNTKWWIAMNMMYSDYCKVAKKLGVNIVDLCVELARAFCEDKDAKTEDKLAAYYTHVVKGE